MEEFAKGSVPVAVVARVYGKDSCWVRLGIISGYIYIYLVNSKITFLLFKLTTTDRIIK